MAIIARAPQGLSVFKIIKPALDELYERIPGKEDEKDAAIASRLKLLSDRYKGLAAGAMIDYSEDATRFAYVYGHVTSHADIVFSLMEESPEFAALFERPEMRITSIGCGPGSDLLGIAKYASRNGKRPNLQCAFLDKEDAWMECWKALEKRLVDEVKTSTSFRQVDVTAEQLWSQNGELLNSDLFTLIYFMSEIDSMRNKAEAFLKGLFEEAKSGAMIVYVDNNNQQFYGWFDSLIKAHGWKVLQKGEREAQLDPYTEDKEDLGEYYGKFGFLKMKPNIAYRVCQKP